MGGWNKGTTIVDWDKRVHEVLGGRFELVSRILTDSGESRLTVKCTTCGAEKEISSISLRGNHPTKVSCRNCSHLEAEQKREFEKNEKQRLREVRKLKKAKQLNFRFCECGSILPEGKRVCKECRRKTRRARSLLISIAPLQLRRLCTAALNMK